MEFSIKPNVLNVIIAAVVTVLLWLTRNNAARGVDEALRGIDFTPATVGNYVCMDCAEKECEFCDATFFSDPEDLEDCPCCGSSEVI